MTKKKIISNTMMFVAIMTFISIFQLVFGNENTLVAVTVITEALVLLERDLTIAPLENFSKLLGMNLLTGFAAYYASSNIWLGMAINFSTLFLIGYLFSYNLRKSIFVPFGLQYLFMLFNPSHGEIFFKRISGLIFGAFFIIALQLLFNRNKVSKAGGKIIDSIYGNILLKIDLLKENKDASKVTDDMVESVNSLKKIIYDKRVNGFYITNAGRTATDILFSLERINILLDKLKEEDAEKEHYAEFLQDMHKTTSNLEENRFNASALRDMKDIYLSTDLNNAYVYEIIHLLETLQMKMLKMNKMNKKDENSIENNYKIPTHFSRASIHKRNLKLDSLRVSYGIRLAIAGSITAFLTGYFHLSEGKWMAYTIFSLIQPYSEISNMKSKQRIEGTLIGALIVYASFSLIPNATVRFLIVLLSGYMNPFAEDYRSLIVCVTVSAVASAALTGNAAKLVLSRIVFVSIGAVISVLINKFVLPYKFEDGKKELVSTYDNLASQMLVDMKNDDSEHAVKNLFLIPALIEDRMKVVRFGENCSKEKTFIYDQRLLVSSIYNHHLMISKDKSVRESLTSEINEIKASFGIDEINYENGISKIRSHLEKVQSPKEKLLLINMLYMADCFNRTRLIQQP